MVSGEERMKYEKDIKATIEKLSELVSQKILSVKIGTELSISEIVREYYAEQGYVFMDIGNGEGYGWSRDGGKTYVAADNDLFDVMAKSEKLIDGKRYLDFSKYENMAVGLPFNIPFVVKEV